VFAYFVKGFSARIEYFKVGEMFEYSNLSNSCSVRSLNVWPMIKTLPTRSLSGSVTSQKVCFIPRSRWAHITPVPFEMVPECQNCDTLPSLSRQ